MLFDMPLIADWNKLGDYRQHQTDLSAARENKKNTVNYDYKVGDRILLVQNGILRKVQSPHDKEPWTIVMTVHTNGPIRIQHVGTQLHRINIRRVTAYTDGLGRRITLSKISLIYQSPTLSNLTLSDRNLSLHLLHDIPSSQSIFCIEG